MLQWKGLVTIIKEESQKNVKVTSKEFYLQQHLKKSLHISQFTVYFTDSFTL